MVCLENTESTIYEHAIKSGVLATNIFKKLESDRLMIHHHGSMVTNYVPPNVSTQQQLC